MRCTTPPTAPLPGGLGRVREPERDGRLPLAHLLSFEATALLLAWVAIVLLAFAMSGLLRQVHALTTGAAQTRPQVGPAVGSQAPAVLLDGNGSSRPSALLFVDGHCETCGEILPEIERIARAEGTPRLALLFPDTAQTVRGGAVKVFQHQAALFDRFRIPATPFGVMVGTDGTVIAAEPIGSTTSLREFLASERSDRAA
jgi:hypothetical protein